MCETEFECRIVGRASFDHRREVQVNPIIYDNIIDYTRVRNQWRT